MTIKMYAAIFGATLFVMACRHREVTVDASALMAARPLAEAVYGPDQKDGDPDLVETALLLRESTEHFVEPIEMLSQEARDLTVEMRREGLKGDGIDALKNCARLHQRGTDKIAFDTCRPVYRLARTENLNPAQMHAFFSGMQAVIVPAK